MLCMLLVASGLALAQEPVLSTGQNACICRSIRTCSTAMPIWAASPTRYPLSALVSLRNTDPRQSIRIVSARYYDTAGKPLREYFPKPAVLPPLGTLELFLERNDLSGGSGANFIIAWQADKPANAPIVEAVHADITGNRTLSFITSARVIK
jgi:hypothetical protein